MAERCLLRLLWGQRKLRRAAEMPSTAVLVMFVSIGVLYCGQNVNGAECEGGSCVQGEPVVVSVEVRDNGAHTKGDKLELKCDPATANAGTLGRDLTGGDGWRVFSPAGKLIANCEHLQANPVVHAVPPVGQEGMYGGLVGSLGSL